MRAIAATLLLAAALFTSQSHAQIPLPADAISSGDLTGSPAWKWEHDLGTPGASVGTSQFPAALASPAGPARALHVDYSGHGGERYHIAFAHDAAATHFIYDAYVYIVDPSEIENLEMDMNQVAEGGDTIIFGTQCAAGSGTWEYTAIVNGISGWHPSNLPCNPKAWTPRVWHHVQIGYNRIGGYVVYDWALVDGVGGQFFADGVHPLPPAPPPAEVGWEARALGWSAGTLLINFQLDGARGSGQMDVLVSGVTVTRDVAPHF